jgi:hypothetical protein
MISPALRNQARISRRREDRQSIALPGGDELMPRVKFAREVVGTSEKGLKKYNLPTTYIGAVAHVPRDASLQIIADTLKQRNVLPKRRASGRGA